MSDHSDSDLDSDIYRSIFETSFDAILVSKPDGSILATNPVAREMFGMTQEEIIAVGIDGLMVHNEALQSLKRSQKDKDKVELTFKRKNGTLFKGEVFCTQFKGKHGIIKTHLSIRDITDLKKYQRQIEHKASLLKQVSKAAKAGIWEWDLREDKITWSPVMYDLFGVDPDKTESTYEVWETFLHPEDLEKANQNIERAINEHGFMDNEYRVLLPDGKIRWINALGQAEYDENNNPLIMTGICIDITQRKLLEINLEEQVTERTKELKLANDYNRNLIETSLDPFVTIGSDGKITDLNKATEKITGYPRWELIGKDFADYFTNPEEAKAIYQRVFKYGTVKDYPLNIKHENGSLTPVLYNASVYKDNSGKVEGVLAAAREITELKKAEEKLRKYKENLEEQVKMRTEELAKSNADLKQFVYVASHDLREPLRMITSFLQLLQRRYSDQLDDDANEFIGFAVDGSRRLDNMIMDLLEYSRIANKEMIFTEIDFEKVINEIHSTLKVMIAENNAHITCDKLPRNIRADENQMILLFQNIISNAIKYRSDEEPDIHISVLKKEDHYVFSVKDNGIGMDPKHLNRIFTIFQRLHTHQEYEGSGIGLSIAQRIVHQHGGEIWVKSAPKEGSTFYFSIKG